MKKTIILLLLIASSLSVMAKSFSPESENSLKFPNKKKDEKWSIKLEEGREVLLQKKKSQKAISDYFDPIISHFEELYKESTNKVYCASDPRVTLFYLISAAVQQDASAEDKEVLKELKENLLFSTIQMDGRGVVVISRTWAEAYYLKAYAYVELGEIERAEIELKHALDLSPLNAIYWAELGHTFQVRKNWVEAKKAFENSQEAASFSPDNQKNHDLARAWRGIGFCLIEMGKTEEAKKQYLKCLELNPDDKKALNELEYIKRVIKEK